MTTDHSPSLPMATLQRRRLAVSGVVQGVGFRPWVQRLALQCKLSGWIANDSHGVTMELQGEEQQLGLFTDSLQGSAPPACRIDRCESVSIDVEQTPATSGDLPFVIRPSIAQGQPSLTIPLDTAPCAECLREFHDRSSRRYHYPFISCPDCGPRWSILRQLPFDRYQTSFNDFATCEHCEAEYNDLPERRYHHQAISCSSCGPQPVLLDAAGRSLAGPADALLGATAALARGEIVAIKSTGGFQLLVDAMNSAAIERLRRRKQRPAKPLAVMFANLSQLQACCDADPLELVAAESAARPIVLMRSRGDLPEIIAPGLTTIGAMLPPSALHVALFAHWQAPLVATSGNLSGEPLCAENAEALQRLGDIADVFLTHNLAITHPVDDSVVRVIAGEVTTLRSARGLAPLLLPISATNNYSILAMGGHGKNSVAVHTLTGILSSPCIGDLDSTMALERFTTTAKQLQGFASDSPLSIACDGHPDYASTRWALQQSARVNAVQHHIAHFFSVLAEYQHRGPALGVSWDGSGWGEDDTLWGGEFFLWDGADGVERIAHLRQFALPGGEAAIREPRRQAMGLLHAMQAEAPAGLQSAFSGSEWRNLQRMLQRQVSAPLTSSAGRLIDVIAALLLGVHVNRFEADAAMQLEAQAAKACNSPAVLPFDIIDSGGCKVIDWQPMIAQLLDNMDQPAATADLAAATLHTLAAIITAIAADYPDLPVFLSGGVFQNRVLVEATRRRLQQAGQKVYTHRHVPPNDSGLAVGQLYYRLCHQ